MIAADRERRSRGPERRARTSKAAAACLVLALVAPAGCKLAEVEVPPAAEPGIVVHAVLNIGAEDETILVEELLSGTVDVPDRSASDSLDPIVSGGGVPIRDATVIVRDLDFGFEVIVPEMASMRADGKGKGAYRFHNYNPPPGDPLPGLVIRRNQHYELEVRWRGYTALARTTVPGPDVIPKELGTRPFNVDHDSLLIDFANGQTSRYVLQTDTPYGPFWLFSARQRLIVRGALRNVYASELPPVFVPGFLEVAASAAVDTNYFDYYRSFNNPFTGSGILSHVDGGVGVFGSVVPMDTRSLDVTADVDEPPIEGHFVGGASGADRLDLYLGENLGGGARRVTGALKTAANPLAERHGIVGVTTGANRLSLAILRGEIADDTLVTAAGVAAGDSVVLAMDGDAPRVFHRLAAAGPAVATAAADARHPRARVLSRYARSGASAVRGP